MTNVEPDSVKERLDLYRTLQRRDRGVGELDRLVDLLESELRAGDSPRDSRDGPASRRR